MKTNLFAILCFAFLCISCNKTSTTLDSIEVIDISNLDGLSSSEEMTNLFSDIKYVALETNDDVLVSSNPNITVTDSFIFVSEIEQPLYMFDRFTGKFIRKIGHIGTDPEGYAKDTWGYITFNIDDKMNRIYFLGWDNDLMVYDFQGNYLSKVKIENREQYSLASSFFLVDSLHIYGYEKLHVQSNMPPLYVIDANTGETKDIRGLYAEQIPIDEVVNSSMTLGNYIAYGGHFSFMDFQGNKVFYYTIGSPSLWKINGKIRIKPDYNDTIYTISNDTIKASYILNLGNRSWPYHERITTKDYANERIAINYIFENNDCVYIHFCTDLYANTYSGSEETFVAFYDKRNKTNCVIKEDNYLDTANNQEFRIRGLSSDGYFYTLLSADKLSDNLKRMLQVDDDSNPVVGFFVNK